MELIYHSSGMSEANQCLGDPINEKKKTKNEFGKKYRTRTAIMFRN
jgi:hypothetical protein